MALKNEARYRKWINYYRSNPHIFIKDYFGVKLYFFQNILIVLMHKYQIFSLVACRGISKTFTISLYASAIAVLYPGSKIVLTSGTKAQAKKIITKKIDQEFRKNFPAIDREIKKIVSGDEPEVLFHNGSSIIALAPNENARSVRATIVIYDESVHIPQHIVDNVYEPMKISAGRMVDLYSNTIEGYVEDIHKKSIYMTSGAFKSSWNWERFLKMYKDMMKGLKTGVQSRSAIISLPYHIAIMAGLTTKEDIKKAKEDNDAIPFLMEYEGEFFGESGDAFFKMYMFEKNRSNFQPFQLKYEINIDLQDDGKDLDRYLKSEALKMPKLEGEVRLMAVDTAPSMGARSDNNIVAIVRLIPQDGYYKKYIVNIKRMKNDVSSVLSKYIKRWYYAFQCDQCALDVQGTSLAVFDEVVKATYDHELGCEYPAWRVIAGNATEQTVLTNMARTKTSNYDDALYSINATDKFNHIIANKLKAALKEDDKIELLQGREVGKEIIAEKFNGKVDPLLEADLLEPYIGTDAMITESVLLEKQIKDNGFIKLKTSGSASKKDRYVTLAYLHYLASLYDNLLEENYEDGEVQYFVN